MNSETDPDSTETTGNSVSIDNEVFARAECLADAWTNGVGKRLYLLSDRIGDHPPVYALTTYEREIEAETGDTIETEEVEGIGAIDAHVSLRNCESRLLSRLQDGTAYGNEMWTEVTVEGMRERFERFLKDRISELMEERDADDIVDIHLLKEVRIAVDIDEEAALLEGNYSASEWDVFLRAVQEESTYIDRIRDVEHPSNVAYSFIPQFEEVPEWRLRAIENHLLGVYKNAPALANVAALLDSEEVSTQAEIAEELDRDGSTISQQVGDVEEWQSRTRWSCENRPHDAEGDN